MNWGLNWAVSSSCKVTPHTPRKQEVKGDYIGSRVRTDCHSASVKMRVGGKFRQSCEGLKAKKEGILYLRYPNKLSMTHRSSLSLSLSLTPSLTHTNISVTYISLCKLQPELRLPPIMARICHQPTNHRSPECLSLCEAVEADLRWSFCAEACS